MTTRNKQSGFGIVEILVVIVVLAVGVGLGWVAYGKFVAKPATTPATQTKTETTTPTVKMLTGMFDSGFAANVSWSYPEGWTLSKTGTAPVSATDSAGQTFTLASPSGNYQVVYALNQGGGFGGACDTQGPDKVR
ncbi:MAG: prepilin-type N-terminal cleavage/methylation domain-containing protein [Candidatus Saccharimonas sp.]